MRELAQAAASRTSRARAAPRQLGHPHLHMIVIAHLPHAARKRAEVEDARDMAVPEGDRERRDIAGEHALASRLMLRQDKLRNLLRLHGRRREERL